MQQSGRPSLAFLFGAGISKKAGLPLASEITPAVLCGEGVFKHTDGRFRFGEDPQPQFARSDDYMRRILLFLQIIKTEADIYYFLDRSVNYEDLYFIANQVFGCLSFDEDNPVAKRFADYLDERLEHVLTGDCYAQALAERIEQPSRPIKYLDRMDSLSKLAAHTCSYIRDVACAMIGSKPTGFEYLRWIGDAVRDEDLGHKQFFTLNYDTLLEQFFRSHKIQIIDGFEPPIVGEGISYFEPRVFAKREHPHVVKLHGSLDWHFNRRKGQTQQERLRLIRPIDPEIASRKFELDGGPLVLVGTHNKPRHYTSPVFEDQHWQFKDGLERAKYLVVCGYSFGDKAINTRVLYWLSQGSQNQVVLIHPKPDLCQKAARGAIRLGWDSELKNGRWKVIEKSAEDVCWNDIREALKI